MIALSFAELGVSFSSRPAAAGVGGGARRSVLCLLLRPLTTFVVSTVLTYGGHEIFVREV